MQQLLVSERSNDMFVHDDSFQMCGANDGCISIPKSNPVPPSRNSILAFFVVRSGFREMGTPEARNLISVRCDLFFLKEGEK